MLPLIQTGGGGTGGTTVNSISKVTHQWLDSFNSGTGNFTQSQPAASDISGLATIGSTGAWSDLQNASGALTLANSGNATTFNQTSAVNWTWANTTAASSGTSQSSPVLNLNGTYWTGAASATDSWTIQDVVTNGTNGASTLTFTHSGSSGTATINVPKLTLSGGSTLDSGASQTVGTHFIANGILTLNRGGGNSSSIALATTDLTGGAQSLVLNSYGSGGQAQPHIQFYATSGNTLDTNIGRISAGTIGIGTGAAGSVAGNLQLTKITNYNGTTAGQGVVPIYGATSQKSESAADTNVLTFTPPAAVGTYRISFTAAVSAASSATLGWTATWTDSNAHAQAPTNLSLFKSGTASPALTFTAAANDVYYGDEIIDVDGSGTSIVVKLTFTGTSFTAKVSATIERLI